MNRSAHGATTAAISRWHPGPGGADAASPVVGRGRLRTAMVPFVVIAAVLVWRVSTSGWDSACSILAVLGVVAVTMAAWQPDRFHAVSHRFGHAVGGVFSVVAFGFLGIFVVLVPYGFQRLFRIDPLEGPQRRPGSMWVEVGRRSKRANSPWVVDAALVPISRRMRRKRAFGLGVVAVTGCLLLAATAFLASSTRFTPFGIVSPLVPARSLAPPFPDETPPAYEDADWYEQHQRDLEWLWTVATGWDPLAMLRFKDAETQTVNIEDGVRRSWKPPVTDDQPVLTVWLYGGSAAFGLGQRDEHTIASELARAAWDDGIAIEIHNRGIPGWLHWQDANRFSWDVATYGPPDAVIFYDGFNEVWGSEPLADVGDGYGPIDPWSVGYWNSVSDGARAPSAPDGAQLLPTPTLSPYVQGEDEQLIMDRYDRSRVMSADTAAANDLEPDWFWQPSRWSRLDLATESQGDGSDYWPDFWAKLVAKISPEVHDVSGALDGIDRAFYYDDVHHNEAASARIADAMWAELRAKYTALTEAKD